MAEPQRAMDKFRGEDMAMPEVKLVQNVGGGFAKDKGARPGDFFIGLTDEVIKGTEGFDIVVIDMTKTRTYWGRAEISDEPPECASLDADSLVSIQNTSCKECPYREDLAWRLSASERRGKCNISYNPLAIVPTDEKRDTNLPVLIRASGISTKPIKELFTQLRLNPKLRTKDGQSLIHKALIHVTSERKKTVSGEAWCYHFRLKSVIPEGDHT